MKTFVTLSDASQGFVTLLGAGTFYRGVTRTDLTPEQISHLPSHLFTIEEVDNDVQTDAEGDFICGGGEPPEPVALSMPAPVPSPEPAVAVVPPATPAPSVAAANPVLAPLFAHLQPAAAPDAH